MAEKVKMADLPKLPPHNMLALAAVELLAHSKGVAPGVHKIQGRITLEVDATVDKLHDTPTSKYEAVPVAQVLALLLDAHGITEHADVKQAVVDLVKRAGTGKAAIVAAAEEGLEVAKKKYLAKPTGWAAGKTTVRGTVRIVGVDGEKHG